MKTKTCNKCGKQHPLEDMVKDKTQEDGYRPLCKNCRKELRSPNKPRRRDKGTFINGLERKIFYTYGLFFKDLFELFKKQEGKCAICGCTPDSSRNNGHKHFAIDHCHSSNKIRGLLCMSCNTAIGSLEDNIDFIDNAKTYITNN